MSRNTTTPETDAASLWGHGRQPISGGPFLLCGLAVFLLGALPARAGGQFGDMLAKAVHGAGGKGQSVVQVRTVPGGVELTNRMQALRAVADSTGLAVESLAATEGGGRFRIALSALGRPGRLEPVLSAAVQLDADGVVRRPLGLAVEEYRNTAGGLRHDVVLLSRPPGQGDVAVVLDLSGARAERRGDGACLVLSSGRRLTYDRLKITDATGRNVPGRIEVAAPDRIVLAVADADAAYPLRIDPTISDDDWFSLGGLPGANNEVSCALWHAGSLYIGGRFSIAGDAVCSSVAKWDGTTWSALGAGVVGRVYALAVDESGNLYAGGGFTTAGGVSANRIAKWDGSAWSALGSGLSGSGSKVRALAVDGS